MAKLKVAYTDGREVEINAGPRAEVALERKFDMSAGDIKRNEHFYYIAWAALHFANQEPAEFDAWLELIDDVVQVDAPAESPDPTRPARRPRTSSD